MAQIARNTADKAATAAKNATANVAEAGKRTSDKTAEAMRETAGQTANAVRDGLRVVRQAAEAEQETVRHAGAGMAGLNRELLDLLHQQARDNVQLVQALAQPAKWGQAAKLQGEFLRASFQRTARFTQRYVEVGQAVVTSALSTVRSQAGKSA